MDEMRVGQEEGILGGSAEGVTRGKGHAALLDFLRRLVKEKPLGLAGGIVTVLLLLTGIFADVIAPYGMNQTNMTDALLSPSAKYLLGTDNLGRDILSRVIYGARISVIVGLTASVLATILNLIIGIVSGYVGGKVDLFIQRFVDAWLCLPGIILLMVIIAIVGPGMWQVIIVLGISWGIRASRVIRSAVIGIKENVYVKASRAVGSSMTRVLVKHILPNIMAPTIILFTVRVPAVILTEAALSFLGFGIPPPEPSWGGMMSGSGRAYMLQAPWMVFWPGLALAVVVYAINMFGDAVRDILDPRLRGGAGRFGVRVSEEDRVTAKEPESVHEEVNRRPLGEENRQSVFLARGQEEEK